MWGEHQGMGWWMLLGSVWFVVLWGILIWVIFQLVDRRGSRGGAEDKAIEILRQRYARGEISREQFNEMQGHLRGRPELIEAKAGGGAVIDGSAS